MFSIKSKLPVSYDRYEIDLEKMRLNLVDERYKTGLIGYEQAYIDLQQLIAVQLMYEFPDYEKRQQKAAAETSSNRTDRMVLGAVIGGVIDSSIGDDDSIIDGAIIGGAIGAATAPVSKIDLKEQKEHFLLMLFKNGYSIKLLVDAEGVADIMQVLHKARVSSSDIAVANPIAYRALNDDEIALAEKAARDNFIFEQKKWTFRIEALLALTVSVTFIALFWYHFFKPFDETVSGYALTIGFAVEWWPVGIIVLIAGIMRFFVSRSEEQKAQDKISQGYGKPEIVQAGNG